MSVEQTPYFEPGDEVCDALFRGKQAFRNRDKTFREGPIEVLPGVWSNDADFLKFKRLLADYLTKTFPENVDEWGRVFGNGVRSNWYGIQHVSGYPQRPATWPITDNRKLRRDSNLANDWTKEWHKNVFVALTQLFFQDLEPKAMKLREGSSSCVPEFRKRMTEKVNIAKTAHANAKKAGELILQGNYEDAYRLYDIGGAYYVVYREQSTDAISKEKGVYFPKDRPVADFLYAITGGAQGTFLPASKSLHGVDFRVDEKAFFRTRKRTAMGGPLPLNAILMPIAQSVRARIYDTFGYTFHHTTRAAMQADVVEMKHIIAADVSQHDQFWPVFLLETIADTLLDMGFADWWVAIYRMKGKMPLYVTDVDEDEGNILLGDWRSPDLQVGLPSGNAFTDLEGTLLMTGVYFILQVEHTLPYLERQCGTVEGAKTELEKYLTGHLPIRLKDKSDDALLGWTDPTLLPAARKLHEKMMNDEQVSDYMRITNEHGGAFLGNILLHPKDMDTSKMVLIGNILSFVNNQFSPEYGVPSNATARARSKRPYPGLGWESLHEVYGSSPIFGDVLQAIEHFWFEVYGTSYIAYREDLLEKDKKNLADDMRNNQDVLAYNDLSLIDQEVIADPSKAEYKFAEEDISDAVRALLFKGIPLEDVEPFFNSIVPRN